MARRRPIMKCNGAGHVEFMGNALRRFFYSVE